MPPDYYPEHLTAHSRQVLQRVGDLVPQAILIGGWASWVRSGGPMSHVIDMIVSHDALTTLRAEAEDMSSSAHIGGKKWRATMDGIHLDLYVPYLSRLGQVLNLRAESLVRSTEQVEGWNVLTVPAHTATKIAALLDRPNSMPGEKDREEILALLPTTRPGAVLDVIGVASTHSLADLRVDLTEKLFLYLGEAPGINKSERRSLALAQREWDDEIIRRTEPAPSADGGGDLHG